MRSALLLTALLPLAVLPGCGGSAPPYNVVLITLDTTRADYLSCYGAEDGQTPFADALARDGVLFERCVSSSGITPVSHASILTGLYPYEHGLRVFSGEGGRRLSADVPTLATVLAQEGYRTAAVHSSFAVSAAFGFDRGFDVFESFDMGFVHDMAEESGAERAPIPVDKSQRRSDETTDLALKFLKETDEPFFLWVHYWDPHDRKRLPPKADLPPDFGHPDARFPGMRERVYAAEVHYQDRQIGRLLDGLSEGGRMSRTIVVLTGDHGQGLADGLERHDWVAHSLLYQEQLHVPLVVRIPGIETPKRVKELVRTVDVLPTILDYAGIAAPTMTGSSLRPEIEGEGLPRIAYAEQLNGYELVRDVVAKRPEADFLYSVIEAGWKLIYHPSRPEASELYHLGYDPGEVQNLFGERPEEALRLMDELARRDPWVDAPFDADGSGADPAMTAALQVLGYAGGEQDDWEPPAWGWTCPELGRVEDTRGECTRCGRRKVLTKR